MYGLGCVLNDIAHVNACGAGAGDVAPDGHEGGDQDTNLSGQSSQFLSLDQRLQPLWSAMKRAKARHCARARAPLMASQSTSDSRFFFPPISQVGFETTIADDVPAPLAAILGSCLAVEPSARPTAQAVRMSLADLSAASMAWPVPQHHSLI